MVITRGLEPPTCGLGKRICKINNMCDRWWLLVIWNIIRSVCERGCLQNIRHLEKGVPKQGISRSRGGYATKIHAVVDALGNPIKIYLTGGQVSDYTPARDLITEFDLENSYMLAGKGFDSQELVDTIRDKGVFRSFPASRMQKTQNVWQVPEQGSASGRKLLSQVEERPTYYYSLWEELDQLSRMIRLECILIWLLWYFANTL